MMTKKVL